MKYLERDEEGSNTDSSETVYLTMSRPNRLITFTSDPENPNPNMEQDEHNKLYSKRCAATILTYGVCTFVLCGGAIAVSLLAVFVLRSTIS